MNQRLYGHLYILTGVILSGLLNEHGSYSVVHITNINAIILRQSERVEKGILYRDRDKRSERN